MYRGFAQRGFLIQAVYDIDPVVVGGRLNGVEVRHADDLEEDLRREPMDSAVIATLAESAQEMGERVARTGVKAILNFAPVRLSLPEDVEVTNVNLAVELEALSYALRNR